MLTLVLGGARSGKSRHAQRLVSESPEVVYIATARPEPDDEEFRARIVRHRADRPAHWQTIEAPMDLTGSLLTAEPSDASILVDCATVWLSNMMWTLRDLPPEALEARVLEEVGALVDACAGRNVVIVSNEVGGGIVPTSPVGRQFRDLQGYVNQALAASADSVVLLVAGLPLVLKES